MCVYRYSRGLMHSCVCVCHLRCRGLPVTVCDMPAAFACTVSLVSFILSFARLCWAVQRIRSGIRVLRIGVVVFDRLAYHSASVIFPVEFCIERPYPSMSDPRRAVNYSCKILVRLRVVLSVRVWRGGERVCVSFIYFWVWFGWCGFIYFDFVCLVSRLQTSNYYIRYQQQQQQDERR